MKFPAKLSKRVPAAIAIFVAMLFLASTSATAAVNPPDSGGGCKASVIGTSKVGTTVTGKFRVTCSKYYNMMQVTAEVQRGSSSYKYGTKQCWDCYSVTVSVSLGGDPAGLQKYSFNFDPTATWAGGYWFGDEASGAQVECNNMGCNVPWVYHSY